MQGSNPSLCLAPPVSLEAYTRKIEEICRQLEKVKASRFSIQVQGGSAEVPLQQCTTAALNQWELALAKLQKRKILLIAVLDGPLCDLSLSLALACDVRLATADACLRRPAAGSGPHMPLPIWFLASLALHAGVLRAQQLLWRRRDAYGAELLACGVVHAVGASSAALLDKASVLAVPSSSPLDLLRRIVLQGFSISGADQIGHSLAVSSLVIAEAVGSAMASGPKLPELRPHPFALTQSSTDAWTLELTGSVSRALPSPPILPAPRSLADAMRA